MWLWLACAGPEGGTTPTTSPPPASTADTAAPARSADASLAALSLSSGVMWPAFDPERLDYAVDAFSGGSIAVDAVPTDPRARVVVARTTIDGDPIDSGATFPLAVDQRIEVVVTSPDGSTVRRYAITAPPGDLPRLTVVSSTDPAPGLLFLCPIDLAAPREFAMIVDHAGVPVWWRDHPGPSFDLKVAPTGQLTYLTDEGSGMTGLVLEPSSHEVAERWTGLVPPGWEYAATDVHEFSILPDGHRLVNMIGGRRQDMTEWGGAVDQLILENELQEFDVDGALVFSFSTAGQLSFDDVPFVVWLALGDGWEYAHQNSIELDPDDGNYVVSERILSQVVKVARHPTELDGHTYAPGEIVWRLGGPADSDFAFVDDERELGWSGFAGQHSARMLPGGRIALYDNATPFDPWSLGVGDSRAVEYHLDTDGWTATRVQDWVLTGSRYTDAAGSVQRLPSGHTLVGWGSQSAAPARWPALTEYDAAGRVAYEAQLPEGLWSYRAWEFERGADGAWVYGGPGE